MLEYLILIAGIALLVKGADYLVEGSSSLAKRWGVPSLVIGLTIVAFGTSMPELIVNVIAAVKGTADVAFGNIIGSNIANTLLILGIAAAISGLRVQRSTTWKEIPFSFLAAALLLLFALVPLLDGIEINALLRTEGIALLLIFSIFLYYVFELAKKNKTEMEDPQLQIKKHSGTLITAMITGGLIALYFGGRWTVNSAVTIARTLGMSEFAIAATVVAVGTSLPELVTTITAARKKDADIAVGNIVGSNIFNILWVLGLTATIRPMPFPTGAVIDLTILLGVTLLTFLFIYFGKKHELERWQGYTFIALYAAYVIYLVAI